MTTELQAKMIVAIAESEFNGVGGNIPEIKEDAHTWAEMVIETAQDKGVFTSMLNADLVWHSPDGKDSICGLTEKGFLEYQRIKSHNIA